MQLIAQASLDPKLNDISHFRAAQSLDWAVVIIPGFQNVTQIVRVLLPPPT
ncbi:MAG: hypothetical protein LW720_20780 [Pirellula sp.]|nr:hypothetical protein [Pirellula sp.]